MAKQNEQKHKNKPVARQRRATATVASVPARASATRTRTQPLPPPETENAQSSSEQAAAPPASLKRRRLLIGGLGLAATTLTLGGWLWQITPHTSSPVPNAHHGDQLVVYWNTITCETLARLQTPLPVAARALSIVHTSMFDAWAAYDPTARGTRLGASLRRPAEEWTLANKCRAISYAAYRALSELFPGEQARFRQAMTGLRYNPFPQTGTPIEIGNLAAQAVLAFRQNDGANQAAAYADYTRYEPLNAPDALTDPNHWQPLSVPAGRAGQQIQRFTCAQWGNVTPFALVSALQYVPHPGPPHAPSNHYTQQVQQILDYSAGLTDEQKVLAEYWTPAPGAQILAHWFAFAHTISQHANHTLDQNVRLFFALANAALDVSIACWATKRAYDSAYPVTAVRSLFKGQQVHAWAGPGRGVHQFNAQFWQPYQPSGMLSPAYPEYCSEQSACSYAAAEILRNFTGSDALGASVTQLAHSSVVEPGVPASPIVLSWPTLSQAAEQAGLAGRYAGLHFVQSDLDGRQLGSRVAAQVWRKAQGFISGQAGS